MKGKSNMRLFGILIMAVAVIVMVSIVYLLPLGLSPAQNDPKINNLITCSISVQNDYDVADLLGGAKIRSYQCQAISQCGAKDGFGSSPSTGIQVSLGGATKSVLFEPSYSRRTDQISLCVPSTSTQGVITLYKEGNNRDSESFTIGG